MSFMGKAGVNVLEKELSRGSLEAAVEKSSSGGKWKQRQYIGYRKMVVADASQLERVELYGLMFSCCQWGEEKLLLDIVASTLLYLPCSWPPHHTGMFLHANNITVHSL